MRYPGTILLLLSFSSLFAQDESISVPLMQSSGLQGSIADFKSMPPDITFLPHGEGARNRHLWIRNIVHALVIAGEVDGPPPDFPKNQNWILSKDHIEVWLAAATDVPMPVIGWGNQFDENEFPKGQDSCAAFGKEQPGGPAPPEAEQKKCRDWVARQQRYRPIFKRLFLRQWLLTLSDDWSKVRQFQGGPANDKGEPGAWSSTTWCLKSSTYEKCEEKQNVQPPEPPMLKELRNPD